MVNGELCRVCFGSCSYDISNTILIVYRIYRIRDMQEENNTGKSRKF